MLDLRGAGKLQSAQVMVRAVIFLGGIALLWVSLMVTLSNVSAKGISQWPRSSYAQAVRAQELLKPDGSGELPQARALALGALNREAVSVEAVRTLGFIAALENKVAQARRLFAYSESLSRRDLPTQLWLIEDSIAREDIRSALVHYDRALRVSVAARDQLWPVLISASNDPAVSGELIRMLAARPWWWKEFVFNLITESQSPAVILELVRRINMRLDDPAEIELLRHALVRLIKLDSFDTACTLYASKGHSCAGLRDGSFESPGALAPFDWDLTDTTDNSASRQQVEGKSGTVLVISTTGAAPSDVARQFLLLRPGSYRLVATVGNVASNSAVPKIALTCAGATPIPLLQTDFSTAPPTGANMAMTFKVPAACRAQWLTISTPASMDLNQASAWIDDFRLNKVD